MAFLGDVGKAIANTVVTTPWSSWSMYRVGGMVIDIPALTGALVTMFNRSAVVRKRVSVGNVAQFQDLAPGNYVALVSYGPGTGTAWSVVVGASSYTVTRLGGGGVTGFIAVG